MSTNYILSVFRDDLDFGDKWGSTMAYLFPLAEIYRRHFGVSPAEYQPSPFEFNSDVPAEYGEDYITTELWDAYISGEFDSEELQYAYDVLNRYDNLLRSAGLSY